MPSLPSLSGPSVKPKGGAKPRKLVVLLHGLGADGSDLIGLAPYWATLLPDVEFIAPDAPYPCDMAPMGRQWFSLGMEERTPENMLAGVRGTAPIVDAFLDATLAERGLGDGDLALVGFSQGTMMSLYVALRRKTALAAVVGYSGTLIGPDLLATELRSRPPVLLVHGDEDPIVPVRALPAAVKALEAAGVAVEHLLRPGLGHGIDEEGLRTGGTFLRQHLGYAG